MSENTPWIVAVNAGNFEREIIVRSKKVPVLAYFWAAWAEPCEALGNALEARANQDPGRFVLAKINADQSPELVQGFRVRGVPAVLAIVGGQMLDGFEGALTLPELDAFLDRVAKPLISPSQELMAQVSALLEAGEPAAAIDELEGFLSAMPLEDAARLCLIDLLLDAAELERAKSHMEKLSAAAQAAPEARALQERLDFIESAPPLEELRAAVEAEPDNLGARIALGRALVTCKEYGPGFDELLEVVRSADEEHVELAKNCLLAAFEVLGLEDELANEYRFKLSLELFA